MKKENRGRASKIDKLPAEIKSQLALMLRDKKYSQQAILKEINQLIKEAGLKEEAQLSRSGLNRYATKMEQVGAEIRQAREVAKIWSQRLGEEPESDIGKLVIEVIKQMAFKTTLKQMDAEAIDPEVLNQLALVTQRLEQASKLSYDREKSIRDEMIKKAAKAVEEAAKANGNKQEDVLKLVQAVYGIN